MNHDPFDPNEYLERLRIAWSLRCEAELRAALAALSGAGVNAVVVARPEPTDLKASQPVVLQAAVQDLQRARAALEPAGWVCEDEEISVLHLARNGTMLMVTSAAWRPGADGGKPRFLRPRFAQVATRLHAANVVFMGVPLVAEAGVYKPSHSTEHVVRKALRALESTPNPRVVDVGTGAGAIALAVARQRPDAIVLALDVDARAVRNARENAERNHITNVQFGVGSLLAALPAEEHGRVDAVLANLPWVPELLVRHNSALGETWRGPRVTIQGIGKDGLDLCRDLARQSLVALKSGGLLIMEADAWQIEPLARELSGLGFTVQATGTHVVEAVKPSCPLS